MNIDNGQDTFPIVSVLDMKSLGRKFIFFFAHIRKIATVQSFLVDLSKVNWTASFNSRLDWMAFKFSRVYIGSPHFHPHPLVFELYELALRHYNNVLLHQLLLIFTVQYMLFFRDKPKFNFSRFIFLQLQQHLMERSFIYICNR